MGTRKDFNIFQFKKICRSPGPTLNSRARFVNFLRGMGIDSQPGGIVLLESTPGILKRSQIRALGSEPTGIGIL
jgi:hypothetical protein